MGVKILVIDDEPNIIDICGRMLGQQGHEVAGALSGGEGLCLLRAGSYDLLLLDIRLPDCDGLDVLSTAQEIAPGTGVIIITGHGSAEVAIGALHAGAQDLLLKPFAPREIVASVQRALDKRRLLQENLRLTARLPILEISKALMARTDLVSLTQLALETVLHELGAERVSLMLLDEEHQELSTFAVLPSLNSATNGTSVRVGQGLAGLAAQRKEAILVPGDPGDTLALDLSYAHRTDLAQNGVGSAICVPLLLQDQVLGVLNAVRPPGGAPFYRDDVDLMSILCGQIAVALENARLFGRAQQEIAERVRVEEALRASEERYRAVSELVSDYAYAFRVDQGGVLTREWVTEAFSRIAGYTPDELDPHGYWDGLAHPDDVAVVHSRLRDVLSGQANVTEYRIVTRDGEVRWLRDHCRPVCAEAGGRVTYIIGAAQDVTERKRVEEYMLRTERLRATGRLAAALAHELNNPLQAIASSIELVLDFPLEEGERQQHLAAVRSEIERLMVLANRVLRFARPPHVERQLVSVREVLRYTVDLAGKQLQHSRIRVRTDLCDDLPPIHASRDHLAQVFLNLIINAVESMPEGGELSIVGRRANGHVELKFADTGPGIPPGVLSHLFEPFYTTKDNGTGLGLSISHDIVQQHNGTLSARNAREGGAVFTITLPIESVGNDLAREGER
jgi:two-component system NtrC family sensor kinase